MALINCKECGKQISSEAEKCPNCGVAGNKKIGCGTVIAVFVLGSIILGSIVSTYESTQPKPIKTAEEIRRDDLRKYFDAWDGSHIALTVAIKKTLNDPDSYRHEKTIYVDNGDHLIVETTFFFFFQISVYQKTLFHRDSSCRYLFFSVFFFFLLR